MLPESGVVGYYTSFFFDFTRARLHIRLMRFCLSSWHCPSPRQVSFTLPFFEEHLTLASVDPHSSDRHNPGHFP
jgi:hypothetical protein